MSALRKTPWTLVFSLFVLVSGNPTAEAQTSLSPANTYGVGTAPTAIAEGDFNRDGKPDLAVVNSGDPNAGDGGNISILLGNGDGTFQEAKDFAVGKNPWSIAVGDFNHDGILDLAVQDSGEASISILFGNGDGSFQSPVKYAVGASGFPTAIAAADLDGDGNLDLVVANTGNSSISVLLGNPDGTFRPAVNYGLAGSPYAVVVGDFDGDKKLDIAVAVETLPSSEAYHGTISVFLGNGDGSFRTPIDTDMGGRSFWIAAGDFNNDGKLDIIVTRLSGVFLPTTLLLFRGNGDGTFAPPRDIDPSSSKIPLPAHASPVVGDFNKDGNLDVATIVSFTVGSGTTPSPVLRVLFGNGNGTFQAPLDSILSISPYSLFTGNVNLDKVPDFVTANSSDNSISVLMGSTTQSEVTLTVTDGGTGQGEVTSDPNGIACPATCSAQFSKGTSITLTAAAAAGSTFVGWSGACTGSGTCVLILDTNQLATATFNLGPPPDFSLQAMSGSLTVAHGMQAKDVITVAPENGSFDNAIQLSCAVSGPSPLATCGLSPTLVTPGVNTTTSALTIIAPALSTALSSRASDSRYAVFLPLPVLALLLLNFASGKSIRRKKPFSKLSAFFIVLATMQAGCGGGSSTPPAVNYTVTITATAGKIVHTTQVVVAVP